MSQAVFTQAMLDPQAAVPEGLINPDGAPAQKRFNVYRNNVAVSLTDALRTAFPVLRKLLGEQNFDAVSGIYLRQFPPQSPLLMFYGAEMPDFLAGFTPLQKLGHLPDVARLELALRHSYHAADAQPIDPSTLETMPADRLMAVRMEFAPAMILLRSRWPIHGVWQKAMDPAEPAFEPKGENVLITRPEYDPEMTVLPPGGGTFIAALQQNQTFGQAFEAAAELAPDFDLTQTLSPLIAGGAITRLNEE